MTKLSLSRFNIVIYFRAKCRFNQPWHWYSTHFVAQQKFSFIKGKRRGFYARPNPCVYWMALRSMNLSFSLVE